METPPRKRQKVSLQYSSSPLVETPGRGVEFGDISDGGHERRSPSKRMNSHEDVYTNTVLLEEEINVEALDENNGPNAPVTAESVDEKDDIGKSKNTNTHKDDLENNQNGTDDDHVEEKSDTHHSISITALSPLKLDSATEANCSKGSNEEEDMEQEHSPEPAFKHLISRFNSIVDDLSNLNGTLTSVHEAENVVSSTLIEFAQLQNKYDSTINELNIKLQKSLTTINGLNNEVASFKQKVDNMHLTIEQSQLDNQKLSSSNELLMTECETLKSTIEKLNSEIAAEKNKRATINSKVQQLKESAEPILSSYASIQQQLVELRNENTQLKGTINEQQVKISSFDDTLKQELESLAQELYIQYAEKHESKISKLRAAYETKYSKKHALFNEKLKLLQEQQNTLQKELSHVKQRLQVETNEKHQLVKLWDEYVALDKKDVDQMSNFVKRLK